MVSLYFALWLVQKIRAILSTKMENKNQPLVGRARFPVL